jgi:hypothetical protein
VPSAESPEASVDSSQPSPVVPPQSESPVPGSVESQQSSAATLEPSADASQPSPVVPPQSESPVPGSVGNP